MKLVSLFSLSLTFLTGLIKRRYRRPVMFPRGCRPVSGRLRATIRASRQEAFPLAPIRRQGICGDAAAGLWPGLSGRCMWCNSTSLA